MLHVTRKEKLPSLPSSSDVRGIISNIGAVVDMGFDDGCIYPCSVNDKAFGDIKFFIKEQTTMVNTKQHEEQRGENSPMKKLKRNKSGTMAKSG